MIVFTILKVIFIILALAGFVLTMFSPVGVVLLIVYLTKNKEQRSKKMLKWSIVLLSGFPLLVVVFLLWALINFIATLAGVNPLVMGGGLMPLSR